MYNSIRSRTILQKGGIHIKPLIKYHSGVILSRLSRYEDPKGQVYDIYDQNLMNNDMGIFDKNVADTNQIILTADHNAPCLEAGQLVFNTVSGECAIVSQKHSGAILPYNFTRIEVDESQIYPRYLMYWFNQSSQALKQFHLFRQGGSMIKKITHHQLQELVIDVPSLEKQKIIGDLAYKRMELKYLSDKREHLMNQYLSAVLFKEE